ncbi:MAG TPA: GFA family protein [Oligoflexia bacterium]|nr:GFA family protein [Oligoflexia bacterium]HMR23905.1 GFA family protein [Oligoflexia bacterium]
MKNQPLDGHCHCKHVSWQYLSLPDNITACNCTVCSRYGVLWAYGYLNDTVKVYGKTKCYTRGDKELSFHFCNTCGCVAYWLANYPRDNGQFRIAVNMRLIDQPEKIKLIPIRHFEGLHSFKDLPTNKTKVKDLWF